MSDRIITYAKAHKEIYCYGAGHWGKVTRIFLQEQGINIDGFVISNAIKESPILNVPVISVDQLIKEDHTGIIISVGNKFRREIITTLVTNGFSDFLDVNETTFIDMEKRLKFSHSYPIDKYVCVLYYHRVCNLSRDTWKLSVPPKLFTEHIKFLKEHYRLLRFEDDWKDIHEKSIVITFDDGYADNFQYALPILEKYKAPATVFVCTEPSGEFWWDTLDRIIYNASESKDNLNWNGMKLSLSTVSERKKTCYALHPHFKAMLPEFRVKALQELANILNVSFDRINDENRLLSDQELRLLSESPYITIGGHTITHTSLTIEPTFLQQKEISNSKAQIESLIEKSINVFSYPFGTREDFTRESEKIVQDCGYKKAASTIHGLADNANTLRIPRIWIPGNCSLQDLKKIMKRAWYLT